MKVHASVFDLFSDPCGTRLPQSSAFEGGLARNFFVETSLRLSQRCVLDCVRWQSMGLYVLGCRRKRFVTVRGSEPPGAMLRDDMG